MEPIRSFSAPWGRLLTIMTLIGCLVLAGIPVLTLSAIPGNETNGIMKTAMLVLFPLIIVFTALFTVRSFDVTGDGILIRRLFWTSRLGFEGLQSVEVDPDAMKGSIRTMGNGGLFSFTGRYRSRKLGSFRVFAMDLKLSVILRYTDSTVVVTPEDPEVFAELVRQYAASL